MVNVESKFNELGVDAITGVELMDWLGLSQFDLADPSRFMRLTQVIDYMKQFPIDTQRYLIRRATNGKNVDKLNQVWEYSELLQKREAAKKEFETAKSESMALGETPDPALFFAVEKRMTDVERDLAILNSEIAIYEK